MVIYIFYAIILIALICAIIYIIALNKKRNILASKLLYHLALVNGMMNQYYIETKKNPNDFLLDSTRIAEEMLDEGVIKL